MPWDERKTLAARAADDLFGLLPPQDVTHPKKFMAAVAATLVKYHQHVIQKAAIAIAQRTDRLTLKIVTEVCDELQLDVSNRIERERVRALPPVTKPDQSLRDRQVEDYEKRVRPMLAAQFQNIPADPPKIITDGKYAQRVAADLAARRARKEMQATDPPQGDRAD